MSKGTMEYSVLRYTPSKFAGEYINLGVLFADDTDSNARFSHINKMDRLSSFDNNVDIEGVRRLLESIDKDVHKMSAENKFILEDFIKYYINGFEFSKPKKAVYEEYDEMVDMLSQSYLRFDGSKAE